VTDPAFEPGAEDGSRDYQDVGEAARQLGGQAPAGLPGGAGADIHPIEESEEVAAAVDDEAPVPELAEAAGPPSGQNQQAQGEQGRPGQGEQPAGGQNQQGQARGEQDRSGQGEQPSSGQDYDPSSSRSTRSG
jgi:hypothetical protein